MDQTRGRSPSDFVGRDEQLGLVGTLVERATAGVGSLALVTGEAGMGKTRLLAEVADTMATAAVVRWATCWEGGGAPAYWPWIQLLRAHAADTDPATLSEDMGTAARDLGRLVPELAPDLVSDADRIDADDDRARFRLFEAITSLFRRASARRPALLVVDDLHWCDVGSALLLSFLQRQLRGSRLVVLGSMRDGEVDDTSDVGRILGDMSRAGHVVPLHPLEPSEVRELLTPTVGPHEAARLAPDVQRRSGGNPLFVRELGQLLASGNRPGLSGSGAIPDTVRSVLQRRLERLPPDGIAVLRVAAVAGEEFTLNVVASAVGVTAAAVLDQLDHGRRARLITEASSAPPRFRFTHALVREVLYEQLPLRDRAELHRAVGEALEQTGLDGSTAEVAAHFLRAAPVIGPARAVAYAERAGESALAQLAFENAAEHFGRALELLGGSDAEEELRARLLLRLGTARLRTGELDDARHAFQMTAAIARRLGSVELLADAALAFGAGLDGFEVKLADQGQIDLLEEALEALPAEQARRCAWVMARLAIALTYIAADDRRRQLADDALANARRAGDEAAAAYALGARCDAMAGPEHHDQRLADATEMVCLAERSHQRALELLGRRHRLCALLEAGETAAFDAELTVFGQLARDRGDPLYLAYGAGWRAMRAAMEGRLGESRRLAEEACAHGSTVHSENVALLMTMLEHQRFADEGRFREAADTVSREIQDVVGPWGGESMWVAFIAPTEYPHEARAALDRLVASDFEELPRDANWLGGLAGWAAEACAAVGHIEAAAKLYDLLAPYGDRFAVEGIAALCHGSVHRHLGLLAAVADRFDEASAHFERAVAANRGAGALVARAHTLRVYGGMLLDRGDRSRGADLLGQAAAIYGQLGMDRRVEQVEAKLGRGVETDGNLFRRDGDYWTLAYAGRSTRLKDAKGLRDIAALIARQGREMHVADLIAHGDPAGPGAEPVRTALLGGDGTADVLDDRARAAYRSRLEELRDELEEAEAFADTGRGERARAEMDLLADELATAYGLGGRVRREVSPAERARKAVAQRIRNSLRRIASEHTELGRHLEHSIRMGRFCSYNPEQPVTWEL